MRARLGVRARGLIAASALFGFVAACGFGVDLDGLFGAPGTGPGIDGGEAGIDGAVGDGAVPKVQVAQLGVGDSFACARRIDGTVMCWGAGTDGRLGDGLEAASSAPVLVRDVNDAIDLSVGDDHACVVRKNNTVACWGQNDARQLGDGTNANAITPRPVVALADATQVAAGGEFSCALKKDGTVHCWGANGSGQLGDNTTTPRSNPAPVLGVADATQVVASYATACALVKSGEVYCWGENADGQVGNGASPTDVPTPVKVDGLTGVVALGHGAAAGHVCAVLASGEARCWGDGGSGQIGNAKSDDVVDKPAAVVGVTDATRIAMGAGFTCAVRRTGGVSCWGTNGWRQLGLGDTSPPANTTSPLAVEGLAGIEQFAAGIDVACALHAGGERISCWGSNRYGTLGRNTRLSSDVPVKVNGVTAVDLGLGREHTCVATPDGALSCWGMNTYRQQADSAFRATGSPVTVAAVSGAQKVAGGDLGTCALFGTEVRCWGYGSYGQLGNGATPYLQTDPVVFGAGAATEVGAGYHFTCALLASKQVACAGLNDDGRLGNTGGDISTPAIIQVTVPGDPDAGADGGDGGTPATTAPFSGVDRISIGRFHSCAVHGGGKVSCWGTHWDGRLGVPANGPRAEPAEVPIGAPAIDVATGGGHSCAALQDGSVRCWGNNELGQVSGGGASGSQLRTPNLGGKQAKAVACGDEHSCALYTDGTVGCWGRGKEGQLGSGLRSDATQPVAVKDLTDVQAIAAVENRTCAIKSDGSVFCWGSNTLGNLGDGVVMQTGVPGAVFGY